MEFKDYYKILGLTEDADQKAVKTAYRRLARQHHPDVSDVEDGGKKFKEISEAYEVLGDEKKRAEYDQLKKYGHGQSFEPPPGWQSRGGSSFDTGAETDFSDFFSSIFGAGSAHRQTRGFGGGEDFFSGRGQDIEMELPLFLEETLEDHSKTVEYRLPQHSGQGRQSDQLKTLKIKIPAGAGDGERIRLRGQGAPGVGGGPAGDLYLRIRLAPHPLFDVAGHDLSITVPVAPWEAALGAKITVPTLSGRISLNVPAGSQSGQRMRIKGKGLRRKNGSGDLFAVLKVVMPPADKARAASALWEQLAGQAAFDPRAEWETR